jgi:hypothetical protein
MDEPGVNAAAGEKGKEKEKTWFSERRRVARRLTLLPAADHGIHA